MIETDLFYFGLKKEQYIYCVFLIYIRFLMMVNKPFLKRNHVTKRPAKTTNPIAKLRYFVEEPFVSS